MSGGDVRPTEDTVARWRSLLGAGASLWAGAGRVEVEPGWWLAFSGVRSVDFNVIVCHGPDGARDLPRSLDEVRVAKVAAVIVLAGPALGMANALAREGWVCVGAKPFEVMTDMRGEHDPAARRLHPSEMPRAHEMIGAAFDVGKSLAAIAVPTAVAESPTREAWGLFEGGELRSCVGVATVEDAIAIWSLATPPELRRRGYGARLMSAVLATKREEGATTALLWASPDGEQLYRKLGFAVVEYQQMWSLPRWAIPPA